MKITIVQGCFLPVPPLMGGAVEKVWFGLGKEFVKQGHEVTHISRRHPDLPNEEVIEGVKHIRVKGHTAPKNMYWLKVLDFLFARRAKKVLQEADILVTNTFWLPTLIKHEKFGKIYVHVARYPKGQMKLYDHVARLQTVSSPIADAIIAERPSSESRVKVVPYPLPDGLSDVKLADLPAEREKKLVYAGRVHPEKGLDLLIEAFAKMKNTDWQLKIVGPWQTNFGGGGDDYLNKLKKIAQNVADRVEFVGPLFDSKDLHHQYKTAGLFVYPSMAEKGETFGLAPLEAMAYGCVPLVSSLECFQDFITDGKNGLIFNHRTPKAVEILTEKLDDLTSDPEKLKSMTEVCFHSSKDFSMPLVGQKYLDDFMSL